MAVSDDLRVIADAELARGGPSFMGWPDRWWDEFLRRCDNGHVSKMTLGTEEGDRCIACVSAGDVGLVYMTFPEDVDGPLVAPEVTL